MGANMTRRLIRARPHGGAYSRGDAGAAHARREPNGPLPAALVERLDKPAIVWLMIPLRRR